MREVWVVIQTLDEATRLSDLGAERRSGRQSLCHPASKSTFADHANLSLGAWRDLVRASSMLRDAVCGKPTIKIVGIVQTRQMAMDVAVLAGGTWKH